MMEKLYWMATFLICNQPACLRCHSNFLHLIRGNGVMPPETPQTVALLRDDVRLIEGLSELLTTCSKSSLFSAGCKGACFLTGGSPLTKATAMQYLRPSDKKQPLSTLLDKKAQKWGLKHTVYSVSGNEYTGEWQANKKHGKGTQVWKKAGAIYDGEWKCGLRDGHGTYSILNPQSNQYSRKYCGNWENGKKHGFGTFLYNCTTVYEGEWSEDTRCGWGRMCYANGDIYEGEWRKDKNHGKGIMRCANGNWYEGSWRDGKKNGYGKFFYSDQGQLYEGFWLDGTAKCGTLSDFGRNEAPRPPKYLIPQLQLVDMQGVLIEAQSAYNDIMTTVIQE